MFGNNTFAFEYSGYGEGPGIPLKLRHKRRYGHSWWHHGHEHIARQNWGENWTPPWLQDEWQGPLFFGMRKGRGRFGPGGEGGRFFGRGDIKFVLLELLQERPMHGYEMIKTLEEKTGGFYTPSPGSIYPTLQMLEDSGMVTSAEVEGKKVYTITDAGRATLAEHQATQEGFGGPPWMRGHGHGYRAPKAEMQALRNEIAETARLLAIAGRMSLQDPEKLTRLHGIIERTRSELNTLIYGDGSPSNQEAQPEQPPTE
ncbi:MAG TPA: PadR family transcriptional regulator [Ktedonobacteraceae bacterium]|nr:PadR family transcriptional regulator [Ktedonobacteraceae bacterium]